MDSIENSQLEIARSIGLTRGQTTLYIMLPQLITRVLPALAGQFVSIIKDSSLLSLIAVNELSQSAGEISATTYRLFETYFLLGLLYFMLTYPLSLLTKALERKFRYED
jgi:polar amino acid transport system permease protein